jgi:hypothetical protein
MVPKVFICLCACTHFIGSFYCAACFPIAVHILWTECDVGGKKNQWAKKVWDACVFRQSFQYFIKEGWLHCMHVYAKLCIHTRETHESFMHHTEHTSDLHAHTHTHTMLRFPQLLTPVALDQTHHHAHGTVDNHSCKPSKHTAQHARMHTRRRSRSKE